MAKGKKKWKQKKQKRINSKLLYNAVTWQLWYITCIYSGIILIKILDYNSYSSLDSYLCMQKTTYTSKENGSEIEEHRGMGEIPWHEKYIEKRFSAAW